MKKKEKKKDKEKKSNPVDPSLSLIHTYTLSLSLDCSEHWLTHTQKRGFVWHLIYLLLARVEEVN